MTIRHMTLIRLAATLCVTLLALTSCGDGGPGGETGVRAGEATSEPTAARGDADSRVVGVADGDTAFIEIDGRRETVRLVGIDAPESDGPYRDGGCFGREASDRLRELLPFGERVRVETDPAQRSSRDQFNRLLGYVFRDDDQVSINQRLVAEGMATVFVFRDDPFGQAEAFRSSEAEARAAGLGIWGACGPDGRTADASAGDDRSCPADRPIKGNLPSAIYHRPGDENYDATRPERCFADAGEAEAEGFRPASR